MSGGRRWAGRVRAARYALVAGLAVAACDAEPGVPTLVNREEVTRALVVAYPDELRDRGVGGTVVVTGRVGTDGHFEVQQVDLVGATDPRFEAAARRVAPTLRFAPIPVETRVTLPLNFVATDSTAAPGA